MSIQKITQKSGVRYRARIRDERGKQVTKTFRRKHDAEIWEREQLRLRERPDLRPDPIVEKSFRDIATEWLESKRPRVSPSTVSCYSTTLNRQIYPWIDEQLVCDLTVEDWEDWFAEVCDSDEWGAVTANGALQRAGSIIRWAKKRYGGAITNPCEYIDLLAKPEQSFDFWSASEVNAFLTATAGDHLSNLYAIALNTGMRRGELIALQWDAVSFERQQIDVRRTWCTYSCQVRETTKGKRRRVLPMGSVVATLLGEQQRERLGQFVFTGERSHRILSTSLLQRVFASACERAGVRHIRFHDLRHTFASHFMMNGGDLFTLQKLLGHRDIATTQRYAHLSPAHLQTAANVVSFGVSQGPADVLPLRACP